LKAVKDLIAYLRALRHPDDGTSLRAILNTPPRGIGPQTQTALETEVEQRRVSLYQVLDHARNLSPSQARTAREFALLLQDLRASMAGQSLSRFISRVLEATALGTWHAAQDPRQENHLMMVRHLAAQYDDAPMPEALDHFLAEAALAFLLLAPPGVSWGQMLSEGRQFVADSPWQALFSGAAITLAVLGFNLAGDALRDILDPRLRV
jgi:superfamily I DNA/RNA helicase